MCLLKDFWVLIFLVWNKIHIFHVCFQTLRRRLGSYHGPLFYNFFAASWFFPAIFLLSLVSVWSAQPVNQSSSAPALVRCGQTEHCCCIASHPTISSIKFGKWHLQSHGTFENGFSFFLFLDPRKGRKSFLFETV